MNDTFEHSRWPPVLVRFSRAAVPPAVADLVRRELASVSRNADAAAEFEQFRVSRENPLLAFNHAKGDLVTLAEVKRQAYRVSCLEG